MPLRFDIMHLSFGFRPTGVNLQHLRVHFGALGVYLGSRNRFGPVRVNFGHVCTLSHYYRNIVYIFLKSTSNLRYNDDQNLVKVQLLKNKPKFTLSMMIPKIRDFLTCLY